jgi:hypothetical protein
VDRIRIIEALEGDTAFLRKHQLMDYSLLFAVENNQKNQKTHYINANKAMSTAARMMAVASPRGQSLEVLKTSPHIY